MCLTSFLDDVLYSLLILKFTRSHHLQALGFDLRSSSFLSFLPWLVMATGSSLAGLLADSLVSSGVDVTSVRKRMQTVAFLVPAVALLVLAQPGLSPTQAVAAMTVALGTTSLGQAGFVANMSDIAPKHAGKMFGLCNTFGCLSGETSLTNNAPFIFDPFKYCQCCLSHNMHPAPFPQGSSGPQLWDSLSRPRDPSDLFFCLQHFCTLQPRWCGMCFALERWFSTELSINFIQHFITIYVQTINQSYLALVFRSSTVVPLPDPR